MKKDGSRNDWTTSRLIGASQTRWWRTTIFASSLLVWQGCSGQYTEDTGSAQHEVVGGSQEAAYPPAGYLTTVSGGIESLCSAVQVGPNLVLTAAHCLYDFSASPPTLLTTPWTFGRGEYTDAVRVTADATTVHPSYNPSGSPRHLNDLALIRFNAAIPGGTWAEINGAALGTSCGTASASQNHTYVGYGRDTTGTEGIAPIVYADRKSATQCVTNIDASSFDATGVSGGLCWGDSGGGLFTTNQHSVSGVLSDFDGVFDCQIGNDMIFTRLTAYKTFICDSTIYVGQGAFCGRSLAAELSVNMLM